MNDKGLFEIAKADARIARLTLDSLQDELSINIAAYHTQQAIEKLLKSVLNLSGVTYPATHNLSLLMDLATQKQIAYPDWLDEVSFMLNAWSTQTRYNASFVAARRDVLKILGRLEEWMAQEESSLRNG
jgi:HEPN domain-containing protein